MKPFSNDCGRAPNVRQTGKSRVEGGNPTTSMTMRRSSLGAGVGLPAGRVAGGFFIRRDSHEKNFRATRHETH